MVDRAVVRAGRVVVGKRLATARPSGHATTPESSVIPSAWAVQVSRHCLYALMSRLRRKSNS